MKLLFLYARERKIDIEHYKADGVHYLFENLLDREELDAVRVIFESTSGEIFQENLGENYFLCSVSTNDFNEYCQMLFDDGGYYIVWVRGGFKHWIPFIEYVKAKGGWLLFYGANTGNERWPYWDIVFDDLNPIFRINRGRVYIPYIKPINQNIFYLQEKGKPIFDVCIGASNIHDKKGQWLGYKIIKNIEEKKQININWIMPGALRRGVKTNEMISTMSKEELSFLTGPVDREHLAYILNKSKLFLHFGVGGQGDRGPLEALACGCQVILSKDGRHSPETKKLCNVFQIENNGNSVEEFIYSSLKNYDNSNRKIIANSFIEKIGIEKCISEMVSFEFI